jgi:5-methylcytosine-specific restriction endonuclease McrA
MAKQRFSLRKCKRRRMPEKRTRQYGVACKLRSSARWQKLRAAYLRRNPVCQDCAQRASYEVHHIHGVTEHPELCFEEENLRALCIPCHEARHNNRSK